MTSSCQQTPTCQPTPDPHAGYSDVPGLRFISVSASQPARERAALEQSVLGPRVSHREPLLLPPERRARVERRR
ncbi:hypothetical protein AOLI_G00207530 [Acnodon oligacanthus]